MLEKNIKLEKNTTKNYKNVVDITLRILIALSQLALKNYSLDLIFFMKAFFISRNSSALAAILSPNKSPL